MFMLFVISQSPLKIVPVIKTVYGFHLQIKNNELKLSEEKFLRNTMRGPRVLSDRVLITIKIHRRVVERDIHKLKPLKFYDRFL